MTDAELDALASEVTTRIDRLTDELHAREALVSMGDEGDWRRRERERALRHARRKLTEARLQVAGAIGLAAQQ